MKTFDDYINENAMEPEQFKINAEQAVGMLKQEIEKLYPHQKIVVYADDHSIVASVYSIKSTASHLDMLNSPSNAQFIMHLSNNFGQSVAMSKFSWEKLNISGRALPSDSNKTGWQATKHKKIGFRKITGNTPVEASKKLLNWFKKNKKEFAK